MKWGIKQAISILLALILVFGSVSEAFLPAYAQNAEHEQMLQETPLVNDHNPQDNQTTEKVLPGSEVNVDSPQAPDGRTWEEAYPNGAFIFRESYLYAQEGDDSVSITVYRMGGRDGSAIARLSLNPVVPDGYTGNAAGLNDFKVLSPEGVKTEGNDEYGNLLVDLAFEAGEYVKNIEIQAVDDDLSEPEEFFIATIYDTEGAEFIEAANRFTMGIRDNDPYVESHVSLVKKEATFDKSAGMAALEVSRTGGIQYVFSVDYKTVSDTALAGVDFAQTEGTLMFNCGQETATLEIPLINDKIEALEADKSFTVLLSNPRGGDIAEEAGEARIYLYNSNSEDAKMNIATLATDTDAVDISGNAVISDEAIASNKGSITVVPEDNKSLAVEEVAASVPEGVIQPMSIVTGNWKPNQGKWKQFTWLAYDKNSDEVTWKWDKKYTDAYEVSDDAYGTYVGQDDKWHTVSCEGPVGFRIYNEHQVLFTDDADTKDPYGYAIMKETELHGLYEKYKRIFGITTMHLSDQYVGGSKNIARFGLCKNHTAWEDLKTDRKGINEVNGPSLWVLAEHNTEGLVNKEFDQDLKARLEENKGNNKNEDFSRPVMAIEDHSGEDNTLFENWVNFCYLERAAINNLNYEVVCRDGDAYLEANTNAVLNQIKPNISFQNGEGGIDTNKHFYVGSNLLFTESANTGAFRIASVELKKKDDNGNWTTINGGKHGQDGWALPLRSKLGNLDQLSCKNSEVSEYLLCVVMERQQKVNIDYSPSIMPCPKQQDPSQYEQEIRKWAQGEAAKQGFNYVQPSYNKESKQWSNTYFYKDCTDLKTLDFNLSNGACLLYDGKMHTGPVTFEVEDYTKKELTMLYYDSEAMSREQKVKISGIEAVTVYIDENSNKKVDPEDTMAGCINDQEYVNSFFAPTKGKDGNMKQKLIKYDYVKVPRKINLAPTDDSTLTYDLKAFFATSCINPDELMYTREMKNYREIDTGSTAVPVYGEQAAKGSITIPLGGDYAPPGFVEGENGGWSWNPAFTGNLKTAFDNPETIIEYATVVGDKVIPPEQTNDYLGSFRNTDQIILQLYDDNHRLIDLHQSVSTYKDIVLGDFEQDQDLNFDVPEGGDNQDTPGTEKPNMSLPNINMPAGPFKVVLDGDTAGFEIGLPLFGGGNQKPDEQDTGLLGKNRSKYLNDMKDAMGKGAKNKDIISQLKEAAKKTKDPSGAALKPKADVDASFMFGFSASFMWKYSDIDSQWHFDQAQILATFNGEVKISQRFAPVPIVYVYIIFSTDVTTGLNINIEEGIDAEGLRTSEVKFSGEISIEIGVEAGLGVGVELCKFEIFLKVNVGLVVELSQESGVNEFSVGAALGFRIVFLFLSYEMEAISFQYGYERGRQPDEWVFEWKLFGQEMNAANMRMAAAGGRLNETPRVQLNILGRAYNDQTIASGQGKFGLMSIPTNHGFELGEYNRGASAVMLAENLRYSSDYRLFEIAGKNYILYMIDGGTGRSAVDADMLVLSGVNPDGLTDPTASGGNNYTVVDKVNNCTENDNKGDSAFDVHVDGSKIMATWVDYQKPTADENMDPEALMKNSTNNTQVKWSVYDFDANQGFQDAVILGMPDNRFNFLPRITTVGGKKLIVSVKASPYTEEELNAAEETFKKNLIHQLGAGTEEEARKQYPYFDYKVGNYRNMNILYGKYSTFAMGIEKDDGFQIGDIAPTEDWKNQGTRIEQSDIYSISANEFYLAYTSSYNYLDNSTSMTAKRLYLRKGNIDADGNIILGDPLLLRTLVDADDDKRDGIYAGATLAEKFIDPFFGGLEFVEGKLNPGGTKELMLLFNMNDRYYVIDEENLSKFMNEHNGTIKPFFSVEDKGTGDSKADFSIGVDGNGNISAVYTSPVPYTTNNAIFLTKYDPSTGTWGKGIMLAMRGMSSYEKSIDENWSREETEAEYFKDNARLIFQKPRVVIGPSGSLILVAQTALTDLQEVSDPMMTDKKVKIPARDKESKKGFYAINFPIGTRTISSPSLTFDHKAFVPGAVLAPRVSFKNVGDFTLRGSQDKPLIISLMLGDSNNTATTSLASWNILNNIPSGETVDTLLDSANSTYGQIGTQILAKPLPDVLDGKYLYFTVGENAGNEETFCYSSLDTSKPEMEGISYYSTAQNKAELVIENAGITAGGETITINGIKYLPLDITAKVKNHGKTMADNVLLKVEYRETDADGKRIYQSAAQIGDSGVIALGPIDSGQERSYITNNSDYKKDGSGQYIIQTDGTLIPDTENDVLIPISYFDYNAPDKSLELRFGVSTSTNEFETSNNIAFASLQPLGSIKMADNITLVPNQPGTFDLEVESTNSSSPDIQWSEMQLAGRSTILSQVSYDDANKKIAVKAQDEGETILRIVDQNTAAYKDVIVKAAVQLAGAPTMNKVLGRNGSVFVYFKPPAETGGVSVQEYIIEAECNETVIGTRNMTPAGGTEERYEFTGLTNVKSYKFRVAAKNSAGTGPWSDWSEEVTPTEGENPPLDAETPLITSQPTSISVGLGETAQLVITAEVKDGGVLSYQWYSNTTNSSTGGTIIPGATDTAYVPLTDAVGTTYYYCTVNNSNDAVADKKTAVIASNSVSVTVEKGVPAIILNASENAVYAGDVSLTAKVTGVEGIDPTGTVKFMANGSVLAELIPIADGKAVYQWKNALAGEYNLQVIYTGDDHYNGAQATLEKFSISKEVPTIVKAPVAGAVQKGEKLANVALTGGQASTTGTFAWTEPDTIVTSPGAFSVTFTPSDKENYNNVTFLVKVSLMGSSGSGNGSNSGISSKGTKNQGILSVRDIDWTTDPVLIDVSATTIISSDIIRYIMQNYGDRDIIINGQGYTITLKKGTFKYIPGQDSYDLGLTLGNSSNKTAIYKLTDGTEVVIIHFNHSGNLPAEATIKIKLGTQYSGQTLYYYYYNPITGTLEYLQSVVVDKDGYVTVKQSSCSDYVFTAGRLQQSPNDVIVGDPGTEEGSPDTIVPYFVKGDQEIIVRFSAIVDKMMHFIGDKETKYLYKNNCKSYSDTAGHWAKNDIDFVSARELFSGVGEGNFSPDSSMTRGMVVTVLGRLWNANIEGFTGSRFTDVRADAWYAPYVEWATERGIVSGIGNNQFAPDKAISREELVVIFANFKDFTNLKLNEVNISSASFTDNGKISPWAQADVNTMQKAGIITGKPGNLFDPQGTATRAEVSAIFKAFIKNVLK